MSQIIFFTGPVRSGKSSRAVNLAQTWGDEVVFVATYRPTPGDAEMAHRVRRHRAERPAWRVLEAPADPTQALAALQPVPSGVVFDCLTLWASGHFEQDDEALLALWDRQLAQFRAAPWPVVIVSDEVGWGLVPPEPALRRYRDLLGWLNQRTAAAADEAWLLVAGCPVRLK